MTPPRTGTFIYHTHIDELRQQPGGLYGALLVVDPSSYDPDSERIILIGARTDIARGEVLFNGEDAPNIRLDAGRTYRIRLIQIMTSRPNMYVALLDPEGKMGEWTLVAKDGADLPAPQIAVTAARQFLSNGETADVLFTPRAAGTWTLETRASNNVVFGRMTVTVGSR